MEHMFANRPDRSVGSFPAACGKFVQRSPGGGKRWGKLRGTPSAAAAAVSDDDGRRRGPAVVVALGLRNDARRVCAGGHGGGPPEPGSTAEDTASGWQRSPTAETLFRQ